MSVASNMQDGGSLQWGVERVGREKTKIPRNSSTRSNREGESVQATKMAWEAPFPPSRMLASVEKPKTLVVWSEDIGG